MKNITKVFKINSNNYTFLQEYFAWVITNNPDRSSLENIKTKHDLQ